jgi:predicted Zn-dependent protease
MLIPLQNLLKNLSLSMLLLCAGSQAEINLPDMGDSTTRVISPEQERRVGAAFMRSVRRSAPMIDDPEIQAYIQSLGYRLVAESDNAAQTFTFFLINEPTINAFAAPGGYIGANTGLILNSRNESELASVLAHEIAHVTQRHMARTFERASQMSLPMAAAMLGAILLTTQNPEAGRAALAAVQAGQMQAQINFTRANEKEADRVGMQVLEEAGFDPRGMPEFFERLQATSRMTDSARLPEWLRTHPLTTNRIADSRNRAEQYPLRQVEDSLGYRLTKTKLEVALVEDPQQAVEVFSDRLAAGKYLEEDIARYGYALALIRARDYGRAAVEIEKLRLKAPEEPAYLLAEGRLYTEQGQLGEGLETYQLGYHLFPNYRPVTIAYVEALLEAKQGERARQVLRDYAAINEPDFIYYRLLAEAENQAGSETEARIALAQYNYWKGDTDVGVQQLHAAMRTQDLDFYQRERIDALIQEWEAELEEERRLFRR